MILKKPKFKQFMVHPQATQLKTKILNIIHAFLSRFSVFELRFKLVLS